MPNAAVLLSDCAVISRRNGELKFMFRVADLQRRQVHCQAQVASGL